jgi:hypothetical protein
MCYLSSDFSYIFILQAVTKAKLGYNPLEVNPEDMVRFAMEQPQVYLSACFTARLCVVVIIPNILFYLYFLSIVSFSDNGFLFCIRCCCNILSIHDLCPSIYLFSCNYNTYVSG